MNTGNLRRYGIALSIIAGLILVACQPSSMEVVETALESTHIPLADVYFSEGLGITYGDLADAHESYQKSLGNNSDSALESSEGASLNLPTEYIPSAYESVDQDDLSYWADALSVPDEKLLVAKLQTTKNLLDDAAGMGLITEDQAKMAYYTSVIDQSSLNPALWAAAVGISTEEFERYVQLGFNYEYIVASNGRSAEGVYEEIYTNYLSSLDPETSPPAFEPLIFLPRYNPMSDSCFSSNFFSDQVNVPAEWTPYLPASQATACPPFQNIRPCSPEECGYPENNPGGPIIGGVGGPVSTGISAAEKGFNEIGPYPNSDPGFIPPLETGIFEYPGETESKHKICNPNYLLLFFIMVQDSHTITFYYDTNGNDIQDGAEKRTDDEYNKGPYKEYRVDLKANEELYACAPIYSGIELRWDDSNKGSKDSFMCISQRAKSDHIRCPN